MYQCLNKTHAFLNRPRPRFNEVQNKVIELIILSLILLSIMNTIGMSIFERTGEIGTLAALGETRRSIISGFILEGFILGCMGAFLGGILGVSIIEFINFIKIKVIMPGASTFFTVKIKIFGKAFYDAFVLSILSSTVAAWLPARKVSRMNIARSLRFNI